MAMTTSPVGSAYPCYTDEITAGLSTRRSLRDDVSAIPTVATTTSRVSMTTSRDRICRRMGVRPSERAVRRHGRT
eukprot:14834436-Heterocapsa_arctica.AAC.1